MSDMNIGEDAPAVIIQAMYHSELQLSDIVGDGPVAHNMLTRQPLSFFLFMDGLSKMCFHSTDLIYMGWLQNFSVLFSRKSD
jgi:hypothetical protein